MDSVESNYSQRSFLVMLTALIVGLALMGLKFYGWWITGSSAILSDALESIINVVASGFALWSVVLAAKPPDESHPYGHGKIEFFSAGFEGALIVIAAVGIFRVGVTQLLDPQILPHLPLGLAIMMFAGIVNLILALALIRTGRRSGSLVLEADGKHIMTDVYTSGGVLVGLLLVYFTGWLRLDGIVACLVGINIIFTGVGLVRQAFLGLMDTSDPDLLAQICDLLVRHRKDLWIDVHRLRAWKSGNRVHVDFHLILPDDLPLAEGHREVKELERIFETYFRGQAEILIHLDPCTDSECPVCRQDPCRLRQHETVKQRRWNPEALTANIPSTRGYARTVGPDQS